MTRQIRRLLLLAILAGALGTGYRLLWSSGHEASHVAGELPAFRTDGRPGAGRYLWDYDDSLAHYREAAERFLMTLRQRHGIEAMIVTLPALPAGQSLHTLAADLLNHWRIGARDNGRGLLLLLVGAEREVRLEVGYALEPLFTDAFSGYIEDLQLGPYYRAGDLGTGLIAVMEEIEQRAALETRPGSDDLIARADSELLSGGAGASRELDRYGAESMPVPPEAPSSDIGAATPAEAWQTMLRQWAGEGRADDPDTYTAMTRLAMGDPNQPDPRALRDLAYWRQADFEVLQDADQALIWFGQQDGWSNAPFLFCRGTTGWQFDIVHQRRLVVMGQAPKWYLAAGSHPYMALISRLRLSTRKDTPPLPALDYHCRDDAAVLAAMQHLQGRLEKGAADTADLLELARLRIATSQRPNLVQPLLEQMLSLDSIPPQAMQYAAVYHVNAFLQYHTALGYAEAYVDRQPQDPWGHDMLGFLHYRLSRFEEALADHLQALSLAPDDGYAYRQLARIYAQLARRTDSDSRRRLYRDQATQALLQARIHSDPIRVAPLERWLQARLEDG